MCLFCNFTSLLVRHNENASLKIPALSGHRGNAAAKNTTGGMADVSYNTLKVQD